MSKENSKIAKLSHFRNVKQGKESGWGVELNNPDWEKQSPICIYIADATSGTLAAGMINWQDVKGAAEQTADFSLEEITEALGTCLSNYLKEDKSAESSRALLMECAWAYFSRTKSFTHIPDRHENVHAVVINYPSLNGEHLLRPFVLSRYSNEGLLDIESLRKAVDMVIGIDKANHPEWFSKGASVHPIGGKQPPCEGPSC